MSSTKRPTRATIAKVAEERPHLLNPMVAFFVMGWERVYVTMPLSGLDQTGARRLVPDFVKMLGVDECVHLLLEAPEKRDDGTDTLTTWLEKVSQD